MTHVIVLLICLSFLRKSLFRSMSFPGGQHPPVKLAAEGDCSSANPTHFQAQDELVADNPPASLAEMGEMLPDSTFGGARGCS